MRLKFMMSSLVVSCILFTIHSAASKQADQKPDLTIVYTNDVLGEIEPCG
jgi:hypothetical protein